MKFGVVFFCCWAFLGFGFSCLVWVFFVLTHYSRSFSLVSSFVFQTNFKLLTCASVLCCLIWNGFAQQGKAPDCTAVVNLCFKTVSV